MYEHLPNLTKAENPEAYKKFAESGIMVAHPVKINGQAHRPDNGVGYHSTIKFFDPQKDHVHKIHAIAKDLKLNPPDPKNVAIEPGMFKDRMGDDVYVIKMHGQDSDRIKEHNGRFSHMGYPATYAYNPHVSVDKATHDKIKASGAKTAHEAGIEFGPAELKQGHNTLATYRHAPSSNEFVAQHAPIIPISSKDSKLEKGNFKNAMAGIAMAGAAVSHNPVASAPTTSPADFYNRHTMLNAISQVESSGGKNTHHAQMGGKINGGQHSYGKYGMTPALIQETIRMNPDLRNRHPKALALKGDQVHKYMHDNKGLEDQVADKHLARLEHHFGQDPNKLGYSWLNGIVGTNKAIKNGEDIGNHWHAKKVRDAYVKQEGVKWQSQQTKSIV